MKTLHQANRKNTIEAYVLVHNAPDMLATINIDRETDHFVYYAGGNYDRKRSATKTISSDLAEIKQLQAEHISRMSNVRAFDLKRARGNHLFELLLDAATDAINQDKRPHWLEESLDLLEGVANLEELQRVQKVRADAGLDHPPLQSQQEKAPCDTTTEFPSLRLRPYQQLAFQPLPSPSLRAAHR